MAQRHYKSVLVVGAGALGSRVIPMLAEGEFDRIGIADGDVVTKKNQISQPAYAPVDTSKVVHKSDFISYVLSSKYPAKEFVSYPFYIGEERAKSAVRDYDMVIDLTDNLQTRLVLNSACSMLSKPIVFASIDENEGFFYTSSDGFACYNCIYRNSIGSPKEGCDSSIIKPTDAFLKGLVNAVTRMARGDSSQNGHLNYTSFVNGSRMEINVAKDKACEICSVHNYSSVPVSKFIQICGSGIKVSLQKNIDLNAVEDRLSGYSIQSDNEYMLAHLDRKSVLISAKGDLLFTGYTRQEAESLLVSLLG